MSHTPPTQWALRALGIALLALGCDQHPVAPARTPSPAPVRPAANVATGPVISLSSPDGVYSLDVVGRVLTTADGIAIPVEPEEMPGVHEAFVMVASLDGPVTAFEYGSPPGGCSELDSSGCTPDATRLPAAGGTGPTATPSLGLEGVSSTSGAATQLADGSIRVERTVTYGATSLGGPDAAGGFSALLPGGLAFGGTDGYAPSCGTLFSAVREFIPAYRAAVRYHEFALGMITARAAATLREQGKVLGETPIGQRPAFGKMKALLEKATTTWGTAGAIGAYELALASFKVHEAKMAFLITMYNSHDCANRTTWQGGAGGDNAGIYQIGGGIIVWCIFVDYYTAGGQFLRTEKLGCIMQMT